MSKVFRCTDGSPLKEGRWYIGPAHGGESFNSWTYLNLLYVVSIDDRYVVLAVKILDKKDLAPHMSETLYHSAGSLEHSEFVRKYYKLHKNTKKFLDLANTCKIILIRRTDFNARFYTPLP